MNVCYITEEARFQHRAEYNTPEWNIEQKILEALHFHFCKVLARTFEESGSCTMTKMVQLSQLEICHQNTESYFKAVYCSAFDEHVGDTLEALCKTDTTHCLQLRVVMQSDDPSQEPCLVLKQKEDQRLRYRRELWETAASNCEPGKEWTGDLTCGLTVPNCTCVPNQLFDMWKSIERDFTTSPNTLMEIQMEEYEGGMEGGAFIDFHVTSDQMTELLARLQALADAASTFGGDWNTEGYLYDDFSVLSISKNDQGKFTVSCVSL